MTNNGTIKTQNVDTAKEMIAMHPESNPYLIPPETFKKYETDTKKTVNIGKKTNRNHLFA